LKKISMLVLLLIFVSAIQAQVDNDFPAPSEDEVPGAKFLQSKYFDGNALWGHINGGADLYLEYGFDKLLFQEVEWNKVKFRIEYYRMIDPAAALGIFSVSRFKCDLTDALTKYICITPYQVQTALGRFYISIANNKGTKEAQEFEVELLKKILDKSNEKLFDLPEPFSKPAFEKYSGKLKLFRGILGLQNGLPQWEDYFENLSNYEIIVLPFENKDGYLNFARIKFVNDTDKLKFIQRIGVTKTNEENSLSTRTNGIFYKVITISANEIYFYETVLSEDEMKLILNDF